MDVTTTREDIVRTCYLLLLGREPDPAGFQEWTALPGDSFSLHAVMAGIIASREFAERHRTAPAPPPPDTLVNDRAQCGEVRLLMREIVNRTARHRIVVDVGAKGIDGSNAYDLLRHFGWKGLLVDASPERCEAIRRDFAGLDFDLAQTTASQEAGKAAPPSSPAGDAAAVIAEPLPALLAAHGIPRDFDLLSVGTGGEDVHILNGTVAAGWQPHWVIIEASHDYTVSSLDQVPASDLVRSLYEIVARTPVNLILKRTGE